MAACPLVDLLAGARLVVGIKGEVAGIGPGQLEQQGSMGGGGAGVLLLAQLFGQHQGKIGFALGLCRKKTRPVHRDQARTRALNKDKRKPWVFCPGLRVVCLMTTHTLM